MEKKTLKGEQGILYWITGLPGVGKTTIGMSLYYELKKKRENVVILDGDILTGILDDMGTSKDERISRAKKYARLCATIVSQNITVICCTVSLHEEVRTWNRKNIGRYVEVLVTADDDTLARRDYKKLYSDYKKGLATNVPGKDLQLDFPENPDLVIENNDGSDIKKSVSEILNFDITLSKEFDRDTEYWNDFYSNATGIDEPSLFAREVMQHLEKGGTLLELGCGNARDSLYFAGNGVRVRAVDASDEVIERLAQEYEDKLAIRFICDDFVSAKVVYAFEYDYCYSRFSIHAINKEQEMDLLRNVYNALRRSGVFFIEVRSVHDDIYGMGQCVEHNAYIYNGHYRRFIDIDELCIDLEKVGFTIDYRAEERGFAPFGDSDPPIIRIYARK